MFFRKLMAAYKQVIYFFSEQLDFSSSYEIRLYFYWCWKWFCLGFSWSEPFSFLSFIQICLVLLVFLSIAEAIFPGWMYVLKQESVSAITARCFFNLELSWVLSLVISTECQPSESSSLCNYFDIFFIILCSFRSHILLQNCFLFFVTGCSFAFIRSPSTCW